MNEAHHVRSPAVSPVKDFFLWVSNGVSRADAKHLTSNGVQSCNKSFVLRNYDLSIYYHQFNLTTHFTQPQDPRSLHWLRPLYLLLHWEIVPFFINSLKQRT